jgi:L-asparaginase
VGVVVATTGFAPSETAAFRALREQGVVLVTAFPSGDNATGAPRAGTGAVPPRADSAGAPAAPQRPLAPSIAAQHLTPQKARILLMLALTRSRDAAALQRMFREY